MKHCTDLVQKRHIKENEMDGDFPSQIWPKVAGYVNTVI